MLGQMESTPYTEGAQTVTSRQHSVEAWLIWGIRATVFFLVVMLSGLAIYYFAQSSRETSPSVLDRDIKTLEGHVRQRPNDLSLRLTLADLYSAKGRLDEAIGQAEQILQENPGQLEAILILAQSYVARAQPEPAINYLVRGIESNKDDPMAKANVRLAFAHQYLGSLYLERGERTEAIAEFRQALEIDRSNADVLYLLGDTLRKQGQLDEAIQHYMKALRFVPEFPQVYAGLARAYTEKGDEDKALFAGGMVSYTNGEYQQAIEALQRASRRVPDMAEVHLGLAMAYEKNGRSAEALEEYRSALKVDKTSIAAGQGISRLGGQP